MLNINNDINIFTYKTNTKNAVKIEETSKQEDTSCDTTDTSYANPADKIYNRIYKLRTNYQALYKMNARNVVSAASNALCKGNSIHTNLSNQIYRHMNEISKLLKTCTSKEELDKKIKEIEDKMNAAAKEADTKIDILIDISDSLFNLGNIAKDMKNNDMNSYEGTEFTKLLIEHIDTKVDSYSNIKDKEDANKKIAENLDKIYGKETSKKLEEKQKEFEEKLKDIKDSLKNIYLDDSEIRKLKTLVELYTYEIERISSILDTINSFKKED